MSVNGQVTTTDTKTKGPVFIERALAYLAGLKEGEELTPEKTTELMMCAAKYGGAFAVLIVSSIVVYVASTDDKALTENFFQYMVFLILPIVVASFIVLPIFTQKMNRTTLILNAIHLIIFILAIYAFYQTKSPESVWFMKYVIYGCTILFFIVSLAIAYKILIRYIYNSRSWGYVVIQLIFYIPCLLLDLIEYLKNELKIAPNTTYILFALEIAIVVLYLIISRLSKYTPKPSTSTLLNDPVFLNKVIQVADSTTLSIVPPPETALATDFTYRANYSISFWAFINQSTDAITLLLLGDPLDKSPRSGKPRVVYESGKYAFYLTNTTTENKENNRQPQFSIKLPIQKWNHFAITYDENFVNVFVNGNLEKIHHFTKMDYPTYKTQDIIAVGSDIPNKNVGAICNVRYHTSPITQYDVITEYNLLMHKNPPLR